MADDKMSKEEAYDHVRNITTRIAKPLLHLEGALLAAIQADQDLKRDQAELKSVAGRLADVKSQMERMNARLRESQDAVKAEEARAQTSVDEAKSQQQRAEQELAKALAELDGRIRQREQASEAWHQDRMKQMQAEFDALAKKKSAIDAAIQALKEKHL